ncbi:MAG TPA: polysaccharide biosynthesis protein, partial [Alphaproteobacteria bacterium]|nr:polysaccharide biosynthesis protein [Alphaproteobacteria bacterium]
MVFEGKKVLVIGGTGSLGGALVRRLLAGGNGIPAHLSILSRDEEKQHQQRLAYRELTASQGIGQPNRGCQDRIRFLLGDVRQLDDVASAIADHDIVISAAALKQVPNCEYFPDQALRTNCLGTQNIVRAIRDYRLPVETVIGISTDKACEPISVMGMTKALQERFLVAANLAVPTTRFICVRYGNVMGSRGSVIPLFLS